MGDHRPDLGQGDLVKRFSLYLLRWQLSTPILWGVLYLLGQGLVPTIIANLVGGCLFFYVDRRILQ